MVLICATFLVYGFSAQALIFIANTGHSIRYAEQVDVSNYKIDLGNDEYIWISYDDKHTDKVSIHLMRPATEAEMKQARLEGERGPPTATGIAHETIFFRKTQMRFTVQIANYRVDGFRNEMGATLESSSDAWIHGMREIAPGQVAAVDMDGIEWVLQTQGFDFHHVAGAAASKYEPFLVRAQGSSPYPGCDDQLLPPH